MTHTILSTTHAQSIMYNVCVCACSYYVLSTLVAYTEYKQGRLTHTHTFTRFTHTVCAHMPSCRGDVYRTRDAFRTVYTRLAATAVSCLTIGVNFQLRYEARTDGTSHIITYYIGASYGRVCVCNSVIATRIVRSVTVPAERISRVVLRCTNDSEPCTQIQRCDVRTTSVQPSTRTRTFEFDFRFWKKKTTIFTAKTNSSAFLHSATTADGRRTRRR